MTASLAGLPNGAVEADRLLDGGVTRAPPRGAHPAPRSLDSAEGGRTVLDVIRDTGSLAGQTLTNGCGCERMVAC